MLLWHHHVLRATCAQRGAFYASVECLQLADGNPRHICYLRHFNRAAQVHTRQSTAFIGRWQTYAITLAVFENITQCQHFRHVLLRFLRQR